MLPMTPLLQLPEREWHARLDCVLKQLPQTKSNPAAPTGQAALRCLAFVLPRALLADFDAACAEPVATMETADWRVVIVLRCCAVVIERATGLLRTAMLHSEGALRSLPGASTVKLLHKPDTSELILHWLRAWCCQQGATIDPQSIPTALRVGARTLARRLHSEPALHSAIFEAISYQPQALDRARALAKALGQTPDHTHYNATLAHPRHLALLTAEAPAMVLPWLTLVREGTVDPAREPKAALKRWVCSITGGKRVWRSLAASPTEVWTVWTRRGGAAAGEALAATVRVVAACATAEPIPTHFLEAVVSRWVNPPSVTESRLAYLPIALRAAPSAPSHWMRWLTFTRELDDIDAWFATAQPRLDKPQRRSGWAGLLSKAHAWDAEQRRQREHREPLLPDLPPVEVGGYVFRTVCTPLALWNAGQQMRNCLGSDHFVMDFARTCALLLLAARAADKRPQAVIELALLEDGVGWQPRETAGFAGTAVPAEIMALLPTAIAHFERVRRARLLPWRRWQDPAVGTPLASASLPWAASGAERMLQISEFGVIQIGHRPRDLFGFAHAEKLVVEQVITGGQAQRLADAALAHAGRPLATYDELAAAMAAVLAAAPGLNQALACYRAYPPVAHRDIDRWTDFDWVQELPEPADPANPADDADPRARALDILDNHARHSRDRARHGRRRIAVR